MKISVCITTYNHEPYIAQAIDSVVMQKADFDYEIIIGEDDSSDRTREIVIAYQKQFPDMIRLFLSDRKNVIYVDGRPTGRWNFVNNLRHARGEYIAPLDGDDYWTSPHKLQKQVDFLESHRDCVLCFHPARFVYESGCGPPYVWPEHDPEAFPTLADLLEVNVIPACSMVFRNGLVCQFPDWYYSAPMGDWPLTILLAQHGRIGYLGEIMAVYRVHAGGVFSSRDPIQYEEGRLRTFDAINAHLEYQFHKPLKARAYASHFYLTRKYLAKGDVANAKSHFGRCLLHLRYGSHGSKRVLPILFLRLYAPGLYHALRRVKWSLRRT